MTIQNSIGAPVSTFGKTLIDDADQPTAVGTLFNNAALTSTTIDPDDIVLVQDVSASKVARTVTCQQIADLAGTGAAPVDATYIVKDPADLVDLTNAQALGNLATGMVKNTTTAGVGTLSLGVQGVDYYAPGGVDVAIADGGTGASTNTAGINNLVSAASLTPATVASTDLILIQDSSDSLNLKSVTAQSIADLGPGGSAAPGDATYIVKLASDLVGLPNAQALSSLNTGLLKSTTATGVVSIAVPNTDYLAPDATLISIALLGTAADKTIYTTGIDTWAETGLTAAGRALIDDATAGDQRTTLGLGTIATQNSNSVTITGGSITGIVDLAVADGGTGSSSFVPFTPICGGTDSDNPLQSVADLGVSGYVLTSNGSGTLPTFQPSGGGGGGVIYSVRVAMTPTQWNAIYSTPYQIIPAQGPNTLIMPVSVFFEFDMAGVAFSGFNTGSKVGLQYGSLNHLTGPNLGTVNNERCINQTQDYIVTYGLFHDGYSTTRNAQILSTSCVNTAVYISTSFPFSGGTGATVYVNVSYFVYPTSTP